MLLKLIFRKLLARWTAIAIIIAAQFVQSAINLLLPTFNASIIDDGIVKGDVTHIWRLGALMLVLTLAQMGTAFATTYFAARTAMEIGAELRSESFEKVQAFSPGEVRAFGAPSLITRATNDVQQIQMVIFMTFAMLVMAPVMAVGGVVMALRQNLQLSVVLVVFVPVLLTVVAILMAKLKARFIRQQELTDGINAVMREQLTGVRVIRAFVRQNFMSRRFGEVNDDFRANALAIGNIFALMMPAIMILANLASLVVVWYGGHLIDARRLEVGSMTAFLSYLMLILMALMMVSMMFMIVPRAEVAAGRITEVLNTDLLVKSLPAAPAPTAGREGTVFALSGAGVQYPGASAPVLHDVTHSFALGSFTGIIGSTGCGKSTLVSLLPRLIDPSFGAVEVSGMDARAIDLAALRARVAFVPQRAYLFSGTIATTVAGVGSDVELSEEQRQQVLHALRGAQAEEFVTALNGGINAEVEAGGTNFSGGQRARLGIARALYRKADLYIFDDAFSALDYATDARLRAKLRDYIPKKAAVIVVAQRVSSLRSADRILVMDAGRIVDSGTHAELLKNSEVYAQIVASQLSEEESR